MYKTGGGPSTAPNLDDVEEKVLGICSNITGLESRNDSDNIPEFPGETEHEIQQTFEDNQDYDDAQKENKWASWNPKALKGKISQALKSDSSTRHFFYKEVVTKNINEITSARMKLVELQMEIARKEHEFVEEEHKIKMIHLANEEKRKQEIHDLLLKKMQ